LKNFGFSMIKVLDGVDEPKYGMTMLTMVVMEGTFCAFPVADSDVLEASSAARYEWGGCSMVAFEVVGSVCKVI
jgi:hypothetical protein